MASHNAPLKSTILTGLFLAVFVGNVFFWHEQILGILLLIFFLLSFSSLVGMGIHKDEPNMARFGIGLWLLLSGVMVAGSVVYYLYAFPPGVAHVLVLLAAPLSLWMSTRQQTKPFFQWIHDRLHTREHRVPSAVWLASTLVLLSAATTVLLLSNSSTTDAIRSIWLVVPPAVFVALALSMTAMTALLVRASSQALLVLLMMVTLFVSLSAALLVLPIGFGFDSFIHQATEQFIALHGSIDPKPFYYIGQYALVLFFHHGFSLPVQLIDAWLVPLLTSILLPIAWFQAARHLVPKQRMVPLTLLGLLLIPLGSFVVTTPQGLANLWTLLGILFSIPYLKQRESPGVLPLLLGAVAGLLTHPIAGIPFVLYTLLLASDPSHLRGWPRIVGRGLFWIIALGGSVILPASFLINAAMSGTPLSVNLSDITASALGGVLNVGVFFENHFDPILDIVYLYGFNATTILLLLAGLGWWNRRRSLNRSLYIPLIMAGMLVVNFLILSTALEFTFLIDYERQNYAERLIPLALFMLVPFVMMALGGLADRLQRAPMTLRLFGIALIATVATSAVYLAYPRHDSFAVSRGFNVSDADLRAVHFIEQTAGVEPYVVLANQSVSAAAIQEIGFTRYYGDQFFYPVPTGNAFYQFFLDMNDQPTRETARAALAHVQSLDQKKQPPQAVYFVVNDYWWQAPRIIENAKLTSNEWYSVADGRIYIFRYAE